MRRSFVVVLMILILLLTGCRVEWNLAEEEKAVLEAKQAAAKAAKDTSASLDEDLAQLEIVTEKTYKDDGSLNTKINIVGELRGSRRMTAFGDTNLPEGAVLTVIFQIYNESPELTEAKVLEGAVPDGPKIYEEDIIVNADGEFSTKFLHRENQKFGKLTVTFRPERQPPELQEVYGPQGENLGNEDLADGKFTYEEHGVEYTGYQVYGASDYGSANSQLWEDYVAFMGL